MKIVHFMLRLFALLLVAIMIGSVSHAYATTDFTPFQNISDSTHNSGSSYVITDGKNIFIMWSEFTSDNKSSDILISKSTDGGVTFSAPKNISNNSGASVTPFAVVDGTNIFVAWTYRYQEDSHSEIYFSKSTDDGNTFSAPQKISKDSSFSSLPFLATDGTNIFVTWFDITYSNNPRSYKNMEVFFSKSTDGGDTFSEPKNLSNNEGFSSFPSIVTDGTNLFVAWQDNTSLGNTDILVSKSTDGGATFSTPLNISNSDDGSVGSHIVTDGTNIFVTWFEFHNSSGDVFFAKSTDGGATFSTPQNISNNKENSLTPFMITNGTTIYVTWTDSTSKNSDIVLSNSTDGGATFNTPQKISNDNGFSSGQSFATDGTNLFFTWEYRQLLTSPLDVFFSKSNMNGMETHEEASEKTSIGESTQISDAEQVQDSKPEPPNYTVGTVQWVDSTPHLGGYGVVKITDPDMNVNPDRVDIFSAKAWSKTDPTGINLDMIESGRNTGIFYIDIEFTSEQSGIQMLKTIPGDVVTVSYLDSTTPDGKETELVDTMDITSAYVSPHKQLKSGILPDQIKCKDNMELIFKNDQTPACVKQETKQKLIERGWTLTGMTETSDILQNASKTRIGLELSDDFYFKGDEIAISGQIWSKDKIDLSEIPVALQVFSSDDELIEIAQVSPISDGEFSHNIKTSGPLWQQSGKYKLVATYGPDNSLEKNFGFSTYYDNTSTDRVFLESNPGNYEKLCGYPVTDDMRRDLIESWKSMHADKDPYLTIHKGTFMHAERSPYLTDIPLLNYWYELKNGQQVYFTVDACNLDNIVAFGQPGPDYESPDVVIDGVTYEKLPAPGIPLIYKDTLLPVLDAENCQRIADDYTKEQREILYTSQNITFETPWKYQISSLMDYCTSIGSFDMDVADGNITWNFAKF